jgi:hypothetical protein
MQTMKNVNYVISNRIALMVFSTILVLAHLSHAQLILVYDANDANMTEYCAIADSIRKENVKVLISCDKYLGDAQAVFKEADPNGTIKKIGECNYSEVRAKVRRMALVTSPFSNTAYPAAGLPGVKTYISVRGSKEQPLKLAQIFDLWQGVVYLDGDGNVLLTEGTSYKLDDLDFRAKGAQTTESVEGKPITPGIVQETETAKTLFEKGKAVLPDGNSIEIPQATKNSSLSKEKVQNEGLKKMQTRVRSSTVTGNRLWQCPKCGKILEKRGLGKYWNPGDPITRVAGNATCGNCMARYDQADVYGGMYDVEEKAEQQGEMKFEGAVSVVTFQLSSINPPNNTEQICSDLLKRKYPKAQLEKFYIIGRDESTLTPDEALAQYKEYVRENKVPDLGMQFDTLTGKDITDKEVVVLFFKK